VNEKMLVRMCIAAKLGQYAIFFAKQRGLSILKNESTPKYFNKKVFFAVVAPPWLPAACPNLNFV